MIRAVSVLAGLALVASGCGGAVDNRSYEFGVCEALAGVFSSDPDFDHGDAAHVVDFADFNTRARVRFSSDHIVFAAREGRCEEDVLDYREE